MNSPSVISLFTGAGGLDLGLEAAGFDTRVAVELDATCAQTLRHNRPWNVIEGDVHGVTNKQILKVAGLKEGEVDLLAGGPPCQPFSKSGYWVSGDSKRLDDPRASTLDAYIRILEAAKPRAFLLENVSGLAYRGKSEGLEYLQRSIDAINRRNKLSYGLEILRVNASHFGVPQIRERVFIIGSREGRTFGSLVPTHGDPTVSDLIIPKLKKSLTAWDAIGDLQDDDSPDLLLNGKWADLLPSVPEGFNYLYHTERGEGLPLFGWRRRFWNFLLKLSKDLPSWTLTAQPGPATGPFHWKNRHLSARELCRLQTFPDKYRILGNRAAAQKQVGNAVPSALAEMLGYQLRARFFDEAAFARSRLTLLPTRKKKCPAVEPVQSVPRKYLELQGEHEAHPGTGQGYGAQKRLRVG